MKNSYFKELTLNLQHEGFTTGQPKDGLLPVELEGQSLCLATISGGVRYWKEDIDNETKNKALDEVIAIARDTFEYMRQMEAAPRLTADGLSGDYRLLADFNGTVLAGHPTQYGIQFITWGWAQNRTALHQGHYYGPGVGASGYTAAKQDFAVRSGLIPSSTLFAPEQLAEVYRSIRETLEAGCPLTDERRKVLESASEQIETAVPDLAARIEQSVQAELNLTSMDAPESDGMQFS